LRNARRLAQDHADRNLLYGMLALQLDQEKTGADKVDRVNY
jgi:hypothetical protein